MRLVLSAPKGVDKPTALSTEFRLGYYNRLLKNVSSSAQGKYSRRK